MTETVMVMVTTSNNLTNDRSFTFAVGRNEPFIRCPSKQQQQTPNSSWVIATTRVDNNTKIKTKRKIKNSKIQQHVATTAIHCVLLHSLRRPFYALRRVVHVVQCNNNNNNVCSFSLQFASISWFVVVIVLSHCLHRFCV